MHNSVWIEKVQKKARSTPYTKIHSLLTIHDLPYNVKVLHRTVQQTTRTRTANDDRNFILIYDAIKLELGSVRVVQVKMVRASMFHGLRLPSRLDKSEECATYASFRFTLGCNSEADEAELMGFRSECHGKEGLGHGKLCLPLSHAADHANQVGRREVTSYIVRTEQAVWRPV